MKKNKNILVSIYWFTDVNLFLKKWFLILFAGYFYPVRWTFADLLKNNYGFVKIAIGFNFFGFVKAMNNWRSEFFQAILHRSSHVWLFDIYQWEKDGSENKNSWKQLGVGGVQ